MSVRERVVRRLDDLGPVVLCADLAELRAMLFGSPGPAVPEEEHPSPPPARCGDLVVDPAGHLVTWRGQPLSLTRLERELLAQLAGTPGGVWSYERIFASVWGGTWLGDAAILHSAVKRLRHKLRVLPDGPQVQTVRGVGYRLVVPGV
ncbi:MULTISPECIES: winged helix-turn-helix domain-containing protein [unclassified Micromonospora]|uniref:winged helix-turn-helix domain-containing protein n=1 Tax=unclassified Micromonospora TaxID=2617518 RepID=UPI001FB7F834|nr:MULTISPECIES: winged helix-turn-helix domain-containing protein [unclassified Micromonospora]